MENKTNIKSFDFSAPHLPSFEEVINNKEWVYWGEDNFWPQHSIDLYNYSAMLRSALNSIRDGIIGKGMLVNGQDGNRVMVNGMESIYDVFKKVSTDMVIHNGFSVNTISRRDGEGIAEFYHMDISKLRAGKADIEDRVKHFYFSPDWSNVRKFKPVELPAFDLTNDEPSQVYFYKSYQPGQFYYPVNEWISGRMAAEIEISVQDFHLNNLENGYNSGVIISMNNGVPGEEERESVYRHLNDGYAGSTHAGKFFVTFSDDKEHAPEILPFTNSASADMFLQLNQMVQQTLLTSTRISSPMLLGIKTEGQLGGRTEMMEAYQHFLSTVVIPLQEKLIREFEKLLFYQTKQINKIEIIQNNLFDEDGEVIVQE